MKYKDYKNGKPTVVLQPESFNIRTQEEYKMYSDAVDEYINQRFDRGDYEFTEEDFQRFEENLDKCWEDLMYTDEDFPKCKMEEILDCAKVLGWGPKSIKDAKNTIYELFESCMNMGCPKMTSGTGGWVVKCDIADHSVSVYWEVGDSCHYDNEEDWHVVVKSGISEDTTWNTDIKETYKLDAAPEVKCGEVCDPCIMKEVCDKPEKCKVKVVNLPEDAYKTTWTERDEDMLSDCIGAVMAWYDVSDERQKDIVYWLKKRLGRNEE